MSLFPVTCLLIIPTYRMYIETEPWRKGGEVIARTSEAKTKSKIKSHSQRCQPASIKLQRIFIFSTVHSSHHHTEYHP